jgi:aminopeptidase N
VIRATAILLLAALTAAASDEAPGRRPLDPASGQRQYAPDRDAAIHHLALDVTPDFTRRMISAQAILTFQPIAQPLEEVQLDAVDLDIQSVVSSQKIDAYQVTADHLVITFAAPISPDTEASVTIRYTAQPEKGLYFRTPDMGYNAGDEHLFTQGEAIDERYWYPGYDSPNQKFTTEITCHVPAGMIALSNGRLVSEEKDAGGLTAFHWSQEQPHANYLVSLVAGYFKKVEDKHKDTPLAFYVPPSDINEAPNSFRDTRDIMEFYEEEIGVPYPWAKYYQVVVQDFMEGGMENTSITTLTERTLYTDATENVRSSQGLIAHEMAHQWFGDLVTCKDWSQIWLNEGFATFYALLYDEHKNGRDAMLYGLYTTARGIFGVSNDVRAIVSRKFDSPDDNFGYLAYDKGGFVLRMLRSQLGEDLYRRCIRTYLEQHKFGNVVTEDLARVVEELSGRSYDQFFDQWVYHAHYPEIDAGYSWDEKAKLAKISIRQTQKTSDDVLLFNFPLTLAFKTSNGIVEQTITVKDKSQDFYFPLDSAPRIVRVDPHLALLAKIDFSAPTPMLYAQLEDNDDVVGRLLAIDTLKDSKGHQAVEKLSHALNHDPFYGVRIEAARALESIHDDESLEALLASMKQSDARVRNRVMSAIAQFYDARALEAERRALAEERNPEIQSQSIRALSKYPQADARPLLLPLLESHSYRNGILDAAIGALSAQDNPADIAPLRDTLKARKTEMTSRGFSGGLNDLATLARDCNKKDEVREFIIGYVNDKNTSIQTGAIRALGALEDPGAIPALQTFASASHESPTQRAAASALEAIRSGRQRGDDLRDLRQTVLDLQKTVQKLRQDIDSLHSKADAKKGGRPASGKTGARQFKEAQ